METNQVGVQQALKKFFTLVKSLEDGGSWESLMKVEAEIRFDFFALSNVVGHEHELVSMDPYCV